jgi:hypothetical protein
MKTLLLKKYQSSLIEPNIRILTDSPDSKNQPTRTNIIKQIEWLVAGLKPGENVYFHFSGHGGLTEDKNNDEKSGKDSCIYPIQDKQCEKIKIIDDELREKLVNKIPTDSKCFAVLDCCHSGTGLDLRYKYNFSNNKINTSTDLNYTDTLGSVIFLSGCKDIQKSADVQSNGSAWGALTNTLTSIWNQSGTPISWADLIREIRAKLDADGFDQIPQLSWGQKNFDINSEFNLS